MLSGSCLARASEIAALNLRDGSILWEQSVPSSPVSWGLAVDRDGRTIVTLENGQVLITGGLTCLEASAVSYIYSPPDEKIDDSGIPGFQTITLLAAAAISIIIVTNRKIYAGK